MSNSNEHLRIRDTREHARESAAPLETAIDAARARELFAQRSTMLGTVERDIPAALFETLRVKIEYEHALLSELIEAQAATSEANKRRDRVLKSEYFIRTPLDTDIF